MGNNKHKCVKTVKGFQIAFLCLLFPILSFAQGEFKNWYFGWKAAISFNSGNPVPFLTSQLMVPGGGSVNISDSLGNIFFMVEDLVYLTGIIH